MSHKKARISVRTLFFDNDKGQRRNCHGLSDSEVSERLVVNLNIADQDKGDKECKLNLLLLFCLFEGWLETKWAQDDQIKKKG